MKLFTVDNKKILKSREFGYYEIGLHLAAHKLSGYQTCAQSTSSCRTLCLTGAGNGSIPKIQEARIRKTKLFFEQQEEFLLQLSTEIFYYNLVSKNQGLKLLVRLNLTSDVDFQQIFYKGKTLFELHKNVQFQDYSKHYERVSFYDNYDITYSYDQIKDKQSKDLFDRGERVAVVFEKELPKTFQGKQVVNGDEHDVLILQPKNVVVGLRYKQICTKNFNNKEEVKKSTLVVKKDNSLNKAKLDIQW